MMYSNSFYIWHKSCQTDVIRPNLRSELGSSDNIAENKWNLFCTLCAE